MDRFRAMREREVAAAKQRLAKAQGHPGDCRAETTAALPRDRPQDEAAYSSGRIFRRARAIAWRSDLRFTFSDSWRTGTAARAPGPISPRAWATGQTLPLPRSS